MIISFMRRKLAIFLLALVLSTGGATIYAQQVNNILATGATVPNDQTNPRLIYEPALGGSALFWLDARAGNRSVNLQVLSDAGVPAFDGGRRLVSSQGDIVYFDVAPDPGNGVFLAWQESGATGTAAFLTYVNSSGTLAWDAPLRLGTTNRQQSTPRVAYDGSNGAYVVWEDRPSSGSSANTDRSILAQRVNRAGSFIWTGGGVEVVKSAATDQNIGDILAINGALVVAWDDTQTFRVYVRGFRRNNGQGYTEEGFRPTNSLFAMGRPRLAPHDPNAAADRATVYVVWAERRIFSNVDIYGQRFALDGSLSWDRSGVALVDESGPQYNQDIIFDGSDGFILAWEDGRESTTKVYTQRYRDNGRRRWRAGGVLAGAGTGAQTNPRIVSDGDRGLICVWEDERGGNKDIYVQKINNAGRPVWQTNGVEDVPVSVQPNEQSAPTLVRLADGRLAVAWQDKRRGDFDIYAQYVRDSGELDNVLPVITSTPDTLANAGATYEYAVKAVDYDQDIPLVYSLLQAPAWLSINAATGLVSGTPVPDPASVAVVVQVADRRGGIATQRFTLRISSSNQPPRITSTPVTSVFQDSTYRYQITISDPDANDSHTFTSPALPGWLVLNPNSGLLAGTPGNDDVGEYDITVRVADRAGASDEQSFTLQVINVNDPPKIVTTDPPVRAVQDSLYRFVVQAEDPDKDDRIAFTFEAAPAWLSIDRTSGEVRGTPKNDDVGASTVTIVATDLAGATDKLTYTLTVENVNDPPFFVSKPITIAYVDSLYDYTIRVDDIDADDELKVRLLLGPQWLTLDANELLLRGTPPKARAGARDSVALEVSDLAGAKAEQRFGIQVLDVPSNDTTAPPPATEVAISPRGWSNATKRTLRWTTPADPSGISAAYINIGAAPQSNSDFDIKYNTRARAGQEDSLEIVIQQEGLVPVHLWLEDGAGNVDFRNAVSTTYRFDKTPPTAPVAIAPLQWSRSDTVRFRWRPSQDTGSQIRAYRITVNPSIFSGEVQATAGGEVLEARLSLNLRGKLFNWRVTAIDSAGNETASSQLNFEIDDTAPLIFHVPFDTVARNQALTVEAEITDVFSGVDTVEVWYRTAGAALIERLPMPRVAGQENRFRAGIAANRVQAPGFEYTIAAWDKAANRSLYASLSTTSSYRSVVVQSSDLVAPTATRSNQYQIISIPFNSEASTLQQFFESNFGTYDDSRWRLLRYQSGNGYIELGQGGVEALRPGRAYWLITRNAQAWKTTRVASVRTDSLYAITLNPGWNMIATPFAFDTDWKAVKLPQGLPQTLWSFDGSGYKMEQGVLRSWQGYFYENTSTTAQTILIAPVAAPASAGKVASAWSEHEWIVQVGAEQDGFTDSDNYFGAGFAGAALSLSEPPAIGTTPRLFFRSDQYAAASGELAVDVRDGEAATRQWTAVVENLSPGRLTLQFTPVPTWPDSLLLRVTDRQTGIMKTIAGSGDFTILPATGERQRVFDLHVVARGESSPDGSSVPQTAELLPIWPNPFRLSGGTPAVIRFTLRATAEVDVRVFNLLGQEVWRRDDLGMLRSGEYAVIWNGRTRFDAPVASGVYLVAVRVNGLQKMQQKLLILH